MYNVYVQCITNDKTFIDNDKTKRYKKKLRDFTLSVHANAEYINYYIK